MGVVLWVVGFWGCLEGVVLWGGCVLGGFYYVSEGGYELLLGDGGFF